MTDDSSLQSLKHHHPEWEPWLGIVQEVLRETADSTWTAVVPAVASTSLDKTPLLAGGSVVVPRTLLRAWFGQLIRVPDPSETDNLAASTVALDAELD